MNDDLALAASEAAHDLYTPTEARMIDMWPLPDGEAEHLRKTSAVRAVLRKYEPSMYCSDEMLDEIVCAAETGI